MTGLTTTTSAQQIDDLYPVAGQDNNSQGFRDNFSYIKNGLIDAGESITNLENITAKLNGTNDFAGNVLKNAIARNVCTAALSSNATSSTLLDISNYNYFSYVCAESNVSYTFNFTWPGQLSGSINEHTKVAVELKNTSGEALPITFRPGSTTLKFNTDSNKFIWFETSSVQITLPTTGSVVIEAWTYDNSTVYLNYVGTFA